MAAIVAVFASSAFADVYVRGYTRSDGTYVQPHYRSSPNSTTLDNYSTRGNTNPYTGKRGTVDPYDSSLGGGLYGSRSRSRSSRGGLYR